MKSLKQIPLLSANGLFLSANQRKHKTSEYFYTAKKAPGSFGLKGSSTEKVAASYSPALHCSTIGASGLNFSVRNGKRWDPAAITT